MTKEYYREYYAQNRERLKANMRAYHAKHREVMNARCRDYYREHREEYKARKARYIARNREKYAEVGAMLRAARKNAGMSQLDLEEKIGISQNSISKWEKGELPIRWDLILPLFPELQEAARKFGAL